MLAKARPEEFKAEYDHRRLSPRTTKRHFNNTALFLNHLEIHDQVSHLE